MKENDLHLVVHADGHITKAFDYWGRLRWSVRSRCDGVGDPGNTGRTDLPNSDTPKGLYKMGQRWLQFPGTDMYPVYGPVCYDFIDIASTEDESGRAGISGHGGRDKSPGQRPRDWTELVMTNGCVRWDDDDILWTIDPAVTYIRERRGGEIWVTVT